MRVALALENFDPLAGGLEKWTVGLAAFLLDKGHDVHVLAFGQANHALPVKMTILPPASGIWPPLRTKIPAGLSSQSPMPCDRI